MSTKSKVIMQMILFCILIALFLVSCATTPVENNQTAFPATITPTPSPSPSPSPSPIPPTEALSATPDPNAPPQGEGYTKDAQGNYTKVESGVTVEWNAQSQTGERLINVGDQGVPLIIFNQQQHNLGGMKDGFDLYASVSDQVPGWNLISLISPHPGAGDKDLSFANQFRGDIKKAFDIADMRQTQSTGGINIDFKTNEGTQRLSLGINGKVIVEILNKQTGNMSKTWTDPYGNSFSQGCLRMSKTIFMFSL